jgi:hypothetical protein
MFETFSKHRSTAAGKLTVESIQGQEDCELWYACRAGWPLQELSFNVVEGTPRRLSCLEDILLHIYRVMADDPPDSQTIAHELAIQDRFFVDETLDVLTALGLLAKGAERNLHITDSGAECHSRGQIPGKTRQRIVSVLFDLIGHDFPDITAIASDSQGCAKVRGLERISLAYQLAEASRIDIETLKKAATKQGLLPKDNSHTIFAAEPADGNSKLTYHEVYLSFFLRGKAQLSIEVHDPENPHATRWFQRVIDSKLKDGQIDLGQLLGSLGPDGKSHITETATTGLPRDIDFGCLDMVPAHMVKDTAIRVVSQAKQDLVMQSRGAGNNGHAKALFEAVRTAAERGVNCHLLWDGGLNTSVTELERDILCHQNIRHRKGTPVIQELLLSDTGILLASWPLEVTICGSDLKTVVLLTGKTSNTLTCKRTAETFAERWDCAESLDDSEDKTGALQNKTGSQHHTKQPSDPSRNVIRVNQTNTLQTLKEAI